MINNGNNFYLINNEGWLIMVWGLDIKPFEIKINKELINFINNNALPINEVCEINDDIDVELYKKCLLMKGTVKRDDSVLLMEDLIKLGLKEEDAELIAIEAGSSQIMVNKSYLNTFPISSRIKSEVLKKICNFYIGEY